MRNTLPLGRIFGIRIGLHRWIPWGLAGLAFFLGLMDAASVLPMILMVVGVFALVLLHELGHSLVAMRFGVKVPEITLWPLGGVAWMEEIPEEPRIEGLIAIAGPAVNLVLALVAVPLLYAAPVAPVAVIFIKFNLMLGLFNLIPAFPMDGGRVLRSLFALRYDWLTATEKAVRIGRLLALVGGVLGFLKGFILVPFLAFYIWGMGQRELFAMRARKLGTGFPLGAFAEAARRAQQQYAKRSAAAPPFGFESAGGFESPGGFQTPSNPGPTQARAPEPESPRPAGNRRGFSDEDIAKLEGFRGRLRRDWREQPDPE